MNDLEKTLHAHDKQIGLIASSVETLLERIEKTDDKIDSIYNLVAKQTILSEKLFHLEASTSGNFVRINQKLSGIDKILNNDIGCSVAKSEKQRLDTAVSTLVALSTRLENLELSSSNKIGSGTVYTIFVLVLGYLITFGVYVEQYLNKLDRNIINNKNSIFVERALKDVQTPNVSINKEAK